MNTILGILGTTTLIVDGDLNDTWGKPKERALLATLAVHAGRVVPFDTLLRWAWPSDTPLPANPGSTCHTHMGRIRKAFERMSTPLTLRTGQGGYRLDIDRSEIDLHRFRTLMAQARDQVDKHPQRVVELARSALALWRGEPLADLSSEPALACRTAWVQNDWLAANRTMIAAMLDLGRHEEAIVQLDELNADHPDDVNLASLRLGALYGLRRFPEGVAYYLATWRRFRDDGDVQSAQHLRRHHTVLAAEHTSRAFPRSTLTPRRLPRDRADFIGRAEELAALDAATTGDDGEPISGVVVLDGTGGVGKTALAVHWAHRARHRFPDGYLFVDLYGFSDRATVDPAAVVDEILLALGQPPDHTLSRRGRELLLESLLAEQRMLVVLDNVRNTSQVQDLVSLLSTCSIIVTSRQRLPLLRTTAGARRVNVRPLPDPEAATLLLGQLGTHHRLADEQCARMLRLCGGIPLFLTVLAEDLAGRPVAQLAAFADELDRRSLIVGIGGHGEGVPTGAACFASSYEALAEADRRLFRLLTVHPGVDISAAAASACNGRTLEETAPALGRLVGANLVESPGELHRYRRHDLVAEFAAYRLEQDETPEDRDAARRRVLDYYVATTTQASRTLYPGYAAPPDQRDDNPYLTPFPDGDEALRWLRRERTTLVAAVRLAHDAGFHDHTWRLTDPVATHFDRSGCHVESRELRELAVLSARRIDEREGEASALLGVSISATNLGDHAAAQRSAEASLRLSEEAGLELGVATALHQLGQLAMARGDSVQALELLERALAMAESMQDRVGICWLHSTVGRLLRTTGRDEAAYVHLRQAQWQAEQIGERSAQSNSLLELGAIYRERGDLLSATGHCEEALEIAQSIPDLAAVARICGSLSEISVERRQFTRAVRYAGRSVDILRGKNIAAHAAALDTLGEALFSGGDRDQAASAWREAADLLARTGDHGQAARVHDKINLVSVGHNVRHR